MRFFSGFSLQNESILFDEFLKEYRGNPYVVAGFSYGAIKALEYVYKSQERVDRLLFLSPSYFLNRSKGFKKAQKLYFKKDPSRYLSGFLKNAAYPAEDSEFSSFLKMGTLKELEELLEYEWPEEKLQSVTNRGVKIEIYLGAKDKIIDAMEAHDFFKNFGQSYLFKTYGHMLKEGVIGG